MMNTATRTAAKKETIWSTFGITTMALMTTMLIVSTYIKIPLPFSSASITAQTLVVNLIGMLFPHTGEGDKNGRMPRHSHHILPGCGSP